MVAGFAACWQAVAAVPSTGFSSVRAADPPDDPVKVDIWYPTKAHAGEHDIGLFTQVVAPDAPADGKGRALIVISHGNGGSAEEHYDTALALARAGFVVASVQHAGDNYQDQSHATDMTLRPRAMHAMIDYMLTAWPGRAAIDPARIGAFGFSSGGFTVLVTVGGVPDLMKVPVFCQTHAADYGCRLVQAHPRDPVAIPADAWIADPRVKAAVVVAPAIGYTFAPDGLRDVRVPIQLWRAAGDRILPSPDFAEAVLHALPRKPEYHVVAGADHFDFLAPCSDALARVAPEICRESGGFDRVAFHRVFDREVVRFFQSTLGR